MPKTLTDNIGSFPSQTCPVVGDARTAGSIETALQNAADRARFARDRIIAVDPDNGGVRKLRYAASLTALRAITDLTENAVIIVDGVGLYIYDASSAATALDPFVVTPTSVGGGAGRWLWEAYLSVDVANGLAKLDANARLAVAKMAASEGGSKILPAYVQNGLVSVTYGTDAGPRSTTSTTYADAGTISLALTLEVNDRVVITGQAYGYQGDATPSFHWTQVGCYTPPSSTLVMVGLTEQKIKTAALNEYTARCFNGVFVATVAGTHTFKVLHKADAGAAGGTVTLVNLNLCAQVFRP
jgi:hypothetical protein